MPQIPPWLQAARTGPLYGQGVGLGLQASQQRIAAQQRAQQLAAQMAAQQQDALIAAQRMAVQQQMAQQEIALKQAELGMSAEQLALKREAERSQMDQISSELAAQQEYRRRVSAGEDPAQVMMEIGPLLGRGNDIDAAMRYRLEKEKLASRPELQTGPVQGQSILGPEGQAVPGMIAVPSASGQGYTVHPIRSEAPEMTKMQVETLIDRKQRQIDKLFEDNENLAQEEPDTKWNTRTMAKWKAGRQSIERLRSQISALETGGGQPTVAPRPMTEIPQGAMPEGAGAPTPGLAPPGPLRAGRVTFGSPTGTAGLSAAPAWPQREGQGAAAPALPMPRSKDQLVEGQLYRTRFGVAEWDGEQFVTPKTETATEQ
jgi:hypothetical protein